MIFELIRNYDKISMFPEGFYEGGDIDFHKLKKSNIRLDGFTAMREDYNDAEAAIYWTDIIFMAPRKLAVHFSYKEQKTSEIFEIFLKNLKVF